MDSQQGRVVTADMRLSVLYTLLRRLLLVLFSLFCFIYPIAVIGVAFDVQPPFSLHWAGSALLFLEGTLLILSAVLIYGLFPALVVSLLVFVLSYLVEAIGVNTGIPFGMYHYTDILSPHLAGGVPLAVMFAWILIVFGSYAWVRSDVRRLSIGVALLGALLATLLDMAIEPVAASVVHYWEWLPPGPISYYGVPFANFVAWFLVTCGLLLLAGRWLATGVGASPRLRPRAMEQGLWENGCTQGDAPTAEGDVLVRRSVFGDPNPLKSALMGDAPTPTSNEKAKTRGKLWLAAFVPRFLFATSLFMFGLVDLTHGYYVATLLAILAACLLFALNLLYR